MRNVKMKITRSSKKCYVTAYENRRKVANSRKKKTAQVFEWDIKQSIIQFYRNQFLRYNSSIESIWLGGDG